MKTCPCCKNKYWDGIVKDDFTIYGLTLKEILEMLDFCRLKGFKSEVNSISPLN